MRRKTSHRGFPAPLRCRTLTKDCTSVQIRTHLCAIGEWTIFLCNSLSCRRPACMLRRQVCWRQYRYIGHVNRANVDLSMRGYRQGQSQRRLVYRTCIWVARDSSTLPHDLSILVTESECTLRSVLRHRQPFKLTMYII